MTTDLTPKLEPLQASHEADELEQQFKAAAIEIYKTHFRWGERDLNVYGASHLGSFALIERWMKAEGLMMNRASTQDSMRYLYKAWQGRHPKRGLHFLRTYLQLLWPNGWDADLMWQRKSAPYPTDLKAESEIIAGGESLSAFYRTSRLRVQVFNTAAPGLDLAVAGPSIRSVCGAKYIVNLQVVEKPMTTIRFGSIGTPWTFLGSEGFLIGLDYSGKTSIEAASIGTPWNLLGSEGSLIGLGYSGKTSVSAASIGTPWNLLGSEGMSLVHSGSGKSSVVAASIGTPLNFVGSSGNLN